MHPPGGCITQQTTNPLAELLIRCSVGPSSMPRCLINRLLAKKYVGSCTELPKPVRTIAAPTPRYKPLIPSVFWICRSPSNAFRYGCCVPTGRKGEYDCRRVFTRKKGEPAAAPRMPDVAPEKMLMPRDCFEASS